MFTTILSSKATGWPVHAGRLLTSVVAAWLAFYPLTAGWAQSDIRVAANPLLAEVGRRNQGMLASVLTKLKPLETGTVRGGSRAPKPTADEQDEIDKNPDFAIAYAHDPIKTLGLLKSINGFLHPDSD